MPIEKFKKTISGKCMLAGESNTNATKTGDFAITIRLPYLLKK